MYIIEGNSFDEVYRKAIMAILREGDEVSPRGSKTYELAPATIVIKNARKFLTMPRLRKGNYTFQIAEALWMLRGSNDLEEIAHYNSIWRNFEDEDEPGILNGAYGERLRNWGANNDPYDKYPGIDQFYEVYEKLKKDPYSRQAVMVIWDPDRDNAIHESGNYSKDIPCTNYFNFQIRNGKLNMWTVMRSNDLHKGSIYDIPNFIIFQHILAGWLDVEVGKYTHSAASLHIYENDVENFIDIFNDNEDVEVYDKEYPDLRLSLIDFNNVMEAISVLELYSRGTSSKEVFKENIEHYIKILNQIENKWWKSIGAQLALYNYRKLGSSENEFKIFLPYITSEYRKHYENLKEIKK